MDPKAMFPQGYHPQTIQMRPDVKGRAKYYTRTARPTKYYLVDFGLSRQYAPDDKNPREHPIWGGDKTVPEFQHSDEAQDPFPTDVYCLGNVLRQEFLQVQTHVIRLLRRLPFVGI